MRYWGGNLSTHFVWVWGFGFTQTYTSGFLLFGPWGYQETKYRGHLELWSRNKAPLNLVIVHGTQRDCIGGWCIGPGRARTQIPFVIISNGKCADYVKGFYVLCGCESWSVILREEYGLRVLEKRVLKEIFGREEQSVWENLAMRSFRSSAPRQIFLWWANKRGWDGREMWHAGDIREVYTILFRKSEGKIPLGRPTHKWDANIKLDFKRNSWADVV